jgi:hypothetical protein
MEELMPRKDLASTKGPNVSRRKFMAGVAVTGAATAVAQDGAHAAPVSESAAVRRPSALRLDTVMAAAETGTPTELGKATGRDTSDFMVDVIKTTCSPIRHRASAASTSR